MEPIKPGTQTSEFKVTLFVIALGSLLQALGAGLAYYAAHAPSPGAALAAGVALAFIGTLAQVIKAVKYTDARTELKSQVAEGAAETKSAP